ncbi:20898_t:CDS:2 [Dentiscutata erythropus]|uniref:20898_t:CDS:1 n=1 Tax=Dentiscutata erythropus TaxID=1348616 RepID=A0A9N9HKG7_9GLOM|nr:20898_t:CDS:2 [Dentiscutata erythropus]
MAMSTVKARHLKDEDLVGKSDPYIELWLEKNYKQKTTTKNNTLEPEYNETFTFHADGHKHLHLRVVDKDLVSDDEIGTGKVDLDKIKDGYFDEWVKLPAMLGLSSKGEIHLKIETAG